MKRIGVVAAVYGALGPARACFQDLWPDVQTIDLYDEYLYQLYHREKQLTDEMYQRVRRLLELSAASGVDGLLFTGSLWIDCVNACREDFDVPLVAAYECLIEKALTVSAPARMVLIATEPGTITSFEKDFALTSNSRVALDTVYIDDAMGILARGDRDGHDALVIEQVKNLTAHDVILLAQFSMESVAERLRQATGKTVYGSLGCAAARLKTLIEGSG